MDERLENIKRRHKVETWIESSKEIIKQDIDYLIQQSEKVLGLERDRKYWYEIYQQQKELSRGQINKLQERVQELERDKAEWEIESHTQNARNKRLEQTNQRYKEDLEFYANEINYQVFIENGKSNIEHDGGSKARQALKGESDG